MAMTRDAMKRSANWKARAAVLGSALSGIFPENILTSPLAPGTVRKTRSDHTGRSFAIIPAATSR